MAKHGVGRAAPKMAGKAKMPMHRMPGKMMPDKDMPKGMPPKGMMPKPKAAAKKRGK